MGRMKAAAVVAALCALVNAAGNALAVGPGKTLTWHGGGQGEVLFDGSRHAGTGHGCKDCHHGLFTMKHGTARITHTALSRGEFCGACHNGKLSFSTDEQNKCSECHRADWKRGVHGEHEGKKKQKHDD
jgi:c(7)-type cytochrome triheme protein